jgi:hypothetical protein
MNKNNNRFFLLIALFFSPQLFGMELEVIPEQPLPGNALVWDLITTRYLLDHSSICSFADASKTSNKIIMNTAQKRRRYLPGKGLNGHLGTLWHKYGSELYYAYTPRDKNQLVLVHYILKDGKPESEPKEFYGFKLSLPYRQIPFMNQDGIISFYGYGTKTVSKLLHGPKDLDGLLRYSFDGTILRCILKSSEKYKTKPKDAWLSYWMKHFVEYQDLLQAILSSTRVEKISVNSEELYNEECLSFSIEGVTFPDNYAQRKQFCLMRLPFSFENFDEFPDIVKMLIKKRYEEQSKK